MENEPRTPEAPAVPAELSDRRIVDTPIGPVCMSRVEYEMYQEELDRRGRACPARSRKADEP